MSANVWIKLYIEVLNDPKMGCLPDNLWRKVIELFLLAGEYDTDGSLPALRDVSWRLRITEAELLDAYRALAELGILHESADGWIVTHFADRQKAMTNAQRMHAYRERKKSVTKRNADRYEADVTLSSSSSVSQSVSLGVRGVGEGETPLPLNPLQASQHPDIMEYEHVTGRIPGVREYKIVIDTIRFLRQRHGPKLYEKVTPYWLAWVSRKARDGRPYDPASLVWLTEWAVNETIPPVGKGQVQNLTTTFEDIDGILEAAHGN